MFWERFYSLCIERGTKPNPVAKKLGFSSAICTKWKNGSTPNSEALTKIANYFDVSVDYLVGLTADKKQKLKRITFSEIDSLEDDEKAIVSVDLELKNVTIEQIKSVEQLINNSPYSKEVTKTVEESKNRADQKGLLLNDKQQKLFNAISNMPDDDIRQALDYIELLKLKRNQKPD